MVISCRDTLSVIINEATNEFGEEFIVDINKLHDLNNIAEDIDGIIKEFDGHSYDIEIDKNDMNIVISFTCHEIIAEDNACILYDLIDKSVGFSVSKYEKDDVQFTLRFPEIWKNRK